MALRWWERWPERLEHELQALRCLGIEFERDEAAFARGLLRLRLFPVVDGARVELIATFPGSYPYFRFELAAPELALPRHQHPFAKNLCLIGRATDNWSLKDTLAAFVESQVPLALKAAVGEGVDAGGQIAEEDQGEPFSDYYSYAPAMLLVDGNWSLPATATHGSLNVGLLARLGEAHGESIHLRGVVKEVRGPGHEVLARANVALLRRHYASSVSARWVRVEKPVHESDAGKLFAFLQRADPAGTGLSWSDVGSLRLQIYGALFPEEQRRGVLEDGWVFAVRVHRAVRKPALERKPSAGSRSTGTIPPASSAYIARVGRGGELDTLSRAPGLSALRDKAILVVGAGALGAPAALEFARAGVRELRLLDDDFLDPATAVRWPFGVAEAGRQKVEVIADFVAAHYPYTTVVSRPWKLGAVNDSGPSDEELLAPLLERVSLIYDAAAEFGVSYFLSERAIELGVPYIAVTATQGAWGGRIVRVRPGMTQGCWSCSQAMRISGALPDPPSDPNGSVQPRGCANPTFTGAGFELVQVAMNGVRVAVATLCVDTDERQRVEWDVQIISLRDSKGTLIAPTVQAFSLTRAPDCTVCPGRKKE